MFSQYTTKQLPNTHNYHTFVGSDQIQVVVTRQNIVLLHWSLNVAHERRHRPEDEPDGVRDLDERNVLDAGPAAQGGDPVEQSSFAVAAVLLEPDEAVEQRRADDDAQNGDRQTHEPGDFSVKHFSTLFMDVITANFLLLM